MTTEFFTQNGPPEPAAEDLPEWYVTMTTGGLTGNSYQGGTPEEAAAAAERDGYDVLDIAELGDGEIVLVVAD
jgi:hypothetical protein